MKYIQPFNENLLNINQLTEIIKKINSDEDHIKDIISSLSDICSEAKIFKVFLNYGQGVKIVPERDIPVQWVRENYPYGFGMLLFFKEDGNEYVDSRSILMTDKLTLILDELIGLRNQLNEMGYVVYFELKDYGMSVGIYEKKIISILKSK